MNSYGLLFETFLWCVRGTHHWTKSAGLVSKCHGGSTSQTVDHCASSTYLKKRTYLNMISFFPPASHFASPQIRKAPQSSASNTEECT